MSNRILLVLLKCKKDLKLIFFFIYFYIKTSFIVKYTIIIYNIFSYSLYKLIYYLIKTVIY